MYQRSDQQRNHDDPKPNENIDVFFGGQRDDARSRRCSCSAPVVPSEVFRVGFRRSKDLLRKYLEP